MKLIKKIALFLILIIPIVVVAEISGETPSQSTDVLENNNWKAIKNSLFDGNSKILLNNNIILDTPKRAEDPALVPVSVKANFEQSESYFIKRIYLVVDNNPSPVVGVFTMPEFTITSLSTRIRVNAYSFVRAIAETSDGVLHMAANYVKASGGCSAPATSDSVESLGKMKLHQWDEDGLLGMQFMIKHPNNSGLQIDQVTRYWIPADYVTELKLMLEGKEILSFSGGISISENPSFRFTFNPDKKEGVIVAEVNDSQGRSFSHDWHIESN